MELTLYLAELEDEINKVIENYENQIAKVAIGKANPTLVNKIKINYYDSIINLDEISSISVASPLQLLVKPYDVGVIKTIEKAILDYKIAASVSNEGHQIRLTYPQMTTEKRIEMTKQLKTITEQARVGIRKVRQDINKEIKADNELSEDVEKHYLENVQKEIDKAIARVDEIAKSKEKDLMTI